MRSKLLTLVVGFTMAASAAMAQTWTFTGSLNDQPLIGSVRLDSDTSLTLTLAVGDQPARSREWPVQKLESERTPLLPPRYQLKDAPVSAPDMVDRWLAVTLIPWQIPALDTFGPRTVVYAQSPKVAFNLCTEEVDEVTGEDGRAARFGRLIERFNVGTLGRVRRETEKQQDPREKGQSVDARFEFEQLTPPAWHLVATVTPAK